MLTMAVNATTLSSHWDSIVLAYRWWFWGFDEVKATDCKPDITGSRLDISLWLVNVESTLGPVKIWENERKSYSYPEWSC